MILETRQLLIRDFTIEDVEDVHVYASNPVVAEHMIWGPNAEEDTRRFVASAIEAAEERPRHKYEFAVIHKAGERLIGGCGIHLAAPLQGEIGYCFHPGFWGQGLATEAAHALLRFGFRELGLHRIYATCRPANIGSARVMQKAGMTYEGHLREHMRHKGKWHDSYQYSILESEYL